MNKNIESLNEIIKLVFLTTIRGSMDYVEKNTIVVDKDTREEIKNCELDLIKDENGNYIKITDFVFDILKERLKEENIDVERNKTK